jgi:hypothetical protein
MGARGTGLYSDDVACDVRNEYKDILREGISEPEATDRMLENWEAALSDQDDAPVFWLALADTQWNLAGRRKESNKKRLKFATMAPI